MILLGRQASHSSNSGMPRQQETIRGPICGPCFAGLRSELRSVRIDCLFIFPCRVVSHFLGELIEDYSVNPLGITFFDPALPNTVESGIECLSAASCVNL